MEGSWAAAIEASAAAPLELGSLGEPPRNFIPIHHVPPRGDVVGSAILVLEVVRVLPYVQPEDGRFAFHQRAVLIRGAVGLEGPAAHHQPRPTAAEARRAVCRDTAEPRERWLATS